MNIVKNVAVSSKKFVQRHKIAVTITATALVCGALNKAALRDHDNFLKEHGLYDEYYTVNEA